MALSKSFALEVAEALLLSLETLLQSLEIAALRCADHDSAERAVAAAVQGVPRGGVPRGGS